MSEQKTGIYNILRGSFLTDESAFKNWRIIIFIVFLLLIVISSAHSIDKKVMKIASLNKNKRILRAEYIALSTSLMRLKMESNIGEQVKSSGLILPKTPPQKIKVVFNNK